MSTDSKMLEGQEDSIHDHSKFTPSRVDVGGAQNTLFRARVLKLLSELSRGDLHIIDADGSIHQFGDAGKDTDSPSAVVEIRDSTVWRDIALKGSIGAAEAYAENRWTTPDLVAVIRLLARNTTITDQMEKGTARVFSFLTRLSHLSRRNTKSGAIKNIHSHYDLGNDFFSLFLDERMMYSSAVFPHAKAGLEEASLFKLERICQKLGLGQDNHLLEIGSGWGGLAVHAAETRRCKVTTVTISRRQFEYVQQQIQARGLQDYIDVRLEDYRNIRGRYDRIVSVEMIEAVGHEYLNRYFDICQQLITADGRLLLQGITVPDNRYDTSRRGVDFIQKYVFPGGGLPSLNVILQSIARKGQLRAVHVEDLASHYARTLKCWRKRFQTNRENILELGFGDEFFRFWEYYFAYCEGGFSESAIGLFQILFVGPNARLDASHIDPCFASSLSR